LGQINTFKKWGPLPSAARFRRHWMGCSSDLPAFTFLRTYRVTDGDPPLSLSPVHTVASAKTATIAVFGDYSRRFRRLSPVWTGLYEGATFTNVYTTEEVIPTVSTYRLSQYTTSCHSQVTYYLGLFRINFSGKILGAYGDKIVFHR